MKEEGERTHIPASEIDFGKKTALIIGNEKNGVSSVRRSDALLHELK